MAWPRARLEGCCGCGSAEISLPRWDTVSKAGRSWDSKAAAFHTLLAVSCGPSSDTRSFAEDGSACDAGKLTARSFANSQAMFARPCNATVCYKETNRPAAASVGSMSNHCKAANFQTVFAGSCWPSPSRMHLLRQAAAPVALPCFCTGVPGLRTVLLVFCGAGPSIFSHVACAASSTRRSSSGFEVPGYHMMLLSCCGEGFWASCIERRDAACIAAPPACPSLPDAQAMLAALCEPELPIMGSETAAATCKRGLLRYWSFPDDRAVMEVA